MSDERLQQRRAAWSRLNSLLDFEKRGVSNPETKAEINELSAFLHSREQKK